MRWFSAAVIAAFVVGFVYGQSACRAEEPQREIRVDTFDARSNRTGHVIIDSRTGRFDAYDVRSNRTSTGTISPPPDQVGGRVPVTVRSQQIGRGGRR